MSVFVDINSWIHALEEMKFSFPKAKTLAIFGLVMTPIAVILHDTADSWLPEGKIPIVSWFQRRWKKDQHTKLADLALFRNFTILFWIASSVAESAGKYAPLDYVSDRLVNSTTRKAMTQQMQQSRSLAMSAGLDALSAAAFDETKAKQLRHAALHRRHVQSQRM